jgi:hypothetical protein
MHRERRAAGLHFRMAIRELIHVGAGVCAWAAVGRSRSQLSPALNDFRSLRLGKAAPMLPHGLDQRLSQLYF